MSFTHLHVHTEYSLLDGVNKIKPLFKQVLELGMHSIAMTDHGVLYGAAEFWKTAKEMEVKPIIGCEIYLAPGDHTKREAVHGIKYYHLVLLAKNLQGYQNLVKIVSIGNLDGMYYKPRVDIATLAKYSEGLVCTTACMAGPLSRHILKRETDKAEDWLTQLKKIFKDDLYIELQRHGFDGSDDYVETDLFRLFREGDDDSGEDIGADLIAQQYSNSILRELAEKHNVKLIASSDVHYLKKEDRDVQSVLFAIKDGKTLDDDTCRKGYEGTYLLSPEELEFKFSDLPQTLSNTLEIDEKIEKYSIKFDRVQPRFWNIPVGKTAGEELKSQTYVGTIKKYSTESQEKQNEVIKEVEQYRYERLLEVITAELIERVDYELMVIDKKGYNDYFLVVGDIMQYARRQGILVGARGSAAGSVIAYVLDITNAEPIKWELYFERFLNLERPSPPDIDMDIQDDKRDQIIDYVKEKYGDDCVAGICTFGKLMTRAAIRDVGRVMDIDLKTTDRLSKLVTVLFGKPFSLDKMMETSPEFASIINSSEELQKLGRTVKTIDGMTRHLSTHAAGYLITPEPITNYMALQRDPKDPTRIITQMDGTYIDKLDYMKFDFLGLRTLTILKTCTDFIKKRHNVEIDVNTLPLDDKKAFELFSKGETVGVFQFESPPMQMFLKELQPHNVEDICLLAAAYRPGPMEYIPGYIQCKRGIKKPEYLIPELEPILNKTMGYPIYQEQLLRICMELGGFTMADGDVIRNALKKKQLDILRAKEVDFKRNFLEKFPKYNAEMADKLWMQLEPFANYGFNKAHSASYAVVAYWCAYLKAYFPLEFMAAMLHSDLGDMERVTIDTAEIKRMGFKILQPDVNYSGGDFEMEGEDTIRFGLSAIKNVSEKTCEVIVAERKQNGLYKSVDDLVGRVGIENISKKGLEYLVKAGALDTFGERNALLAVIPEVVGKFQSKKKNADDTQEGLFGNDEPDSKVFTATRLPEVEPVRDSEKMNWEKELLGMFVTTHPLDAFNWTRLTHKLNYANEFEDLKDQSQAKFLGIISAIKYTFTKKDNSKMAILTIEDFTGKIDAVVFPKKYEQVKHLLVESKPVLVSGQLNVKDERRSLIINEIDVASALSRPKKVVIDICGVKDPGKLNCIKEVLVDGGEAELEIRYGDKKSPQKKFKRINLTDETVDCLREWVV